VCRQRACIQPYNMPVERGSQSTDAVSKTVAACLCVVEVTRNLSKRVCCDNATLNC
jgi:hypothetical protein